MNLYLLLFTFLGPVQPCPGYGTLFVPHLVPFQQKFAFGIARQFCKYSWGAIPYNTPGYKECEEKLMVRMKSLFKMAELPKVFTEPEDPAAGDRHVICFKRKF